MDSQFDCNALEFEKILGWMQTYGVELSEILLAEQRDEEHIEELCQRVSAVVKVRLLKCLVL